MFIKFLVFCIFICGSLCNNCRSNFYSREICEKDETDYSSFYFGETYLTKFVKLKYVEGTWFDQFRLFKQYIKERRITSTFKEEVMPAYAIFIKPNENNWIYFFDKSSFVHTELAIFNFFYIKNEENMKGRLILYVFSSPCNLCLLSLENILLQNKDLIILFKYQKDVKRENNEYLFKHKNELIRNTLFKNCVEKKTYTLFNDCINTARATIVGAKKSPIHRLKITQLN